MRLLGALSWGEYILHVGWMWPMGTTAQTGGHDFILWYYSCDCVLLQGKGILKM